ncbi:MAG: hypothetical protein IPK91_06165 [Saprospiraceae bacterium]|nr:hypothetical protein [Saprospiraceae bacterium]
MEIREFETNNNFFLTECGTCSGWTFNVSCNKSLKQGIIQISKCKNENQYTVEATSLEEDCNIENRDYPTERDALIRFLSQNFMRIDNSDPCESFHEDHPLCPTCNDETIASENELI